MIARSTAARWAVISDVSPELRPKSSMTEIRSWEPALVRMLVMRSTPRVTAVEKPMQ